MTATAAATALHAVEQTLPAPPAPRKIDFWLLAGVVVAIGAVFAGIACAGIRLGYFFRPTGVLIVLGGTLGVTLITTPRQALYRAARGALALLWARPDKRQVLSMRWLRFRKRCVRKDSSVWSH